MKTVFQFHLIYQEKFITYVISRTVIYFSGFLPIWYRNIPKNREWSTVMVYFQSGC